MKTFQSGSGGCGHHVLVRFPGRKVAATGAAGLSYLGAIVQPAQTAREQAITVSFNAFIYLFSCRASCGFFFNLIAEKLNNEHIEQRNEEDTEESTCQHTA